jgi:hypothetical protein
MLSDEYEQEESEQQELMGEMRKTGASSHLLRSKPDFWHKDSTDDEELLGSCHFIPFCGGFTALTETVGCEWEPEELEEFQTRAGPALIHGYFGQVLLSADAPKEGRIATVEEVAAAKRNWETKAEKVAFAGVSVLVMKKIVMSESMILKRLAALGTLKNPWEEDAQA